MPRPNPNSHTSHIFVERRARRRVETEEVSHTNAEDVAEKARHNDNAKTSEEKVEEAEVVLAHIDEIPDEGLHSEPAHHSLDEVLADIEAAFEAERVFLQSVGLVAVNPELELQRVA